MAKRLIDTNSDDKFALEDDLSSKATKSSITAGTKCKITYNSEGIVTSGANLTTSDIPSLAASKITSGTFASARLPTATSSAKGAVMPVAKTAEMTQNVGVDSSGRLYTTPGGVTKIVAGDNVTISPSTGVGEVTVGVSNLPSLVGHTYDLSVDDQFAKMCIDAVRALGATVVNAPDLPSMIDGENTQFPMDEQ